MKRSLRKSRRCDYQCNAPPDEQQRGTQRCRNRSADLVLVGIAGMEVYQHRCPIHQQVKYRNLPVIKLADILIDPSMNQRSKP